MAQWKYGSPGCGCCSGGCNRNCDSPITDGWLIVGIAANHWSGLSLTGVTANMLIGDPDFLDIEVRSLFGEWRVQVIGATGVIAQYSAGTMPAAPITLTLSEANGSGVSGTITKTSSLADDQDIVVRGTRRPKLVVGGTRIRTISWELLSIPDPWAWEFDTFTPSFPPQPVTLTDLWHGTSGLLGEYIVELDELQCRDGSFFGINPFTFVDPFANAHVGTLDGWSILFSEENQRLEHTLTTVPAYYALSFVDTGEETHPIPINASSIEHDKLFQFAGSERILLNGTLSLIFRATTCLALPTKTEEIYTSNLSGYRTASAGSPYENSGNVTWRMRLLE